MFLMVTNFVVQSKVMFKSECSRIYFELTFVNCSCEIEHYYIFRHLN